MSVEKPVVLITGASSGIGLALLQQLLRASRAYRIVASARGESLKRFDELGIVESDELCMLPLDLTKPEECDAIIESIQAKWGGVDILVNNAGISYRSVIEHAREADVQLQFETNVMAPMHLTRLCLPHMRAKRSGHIINISSVGGMMAMPTMGLYSASKFALEGFSEALYYEMRPWDVHVSLIQPGFVRSDSFQNVYLSGDARKAIDTKGRYANYYLHMSRFIEKYMNGARATPESIALKIIEVMQQKNPQLRVPASLDARFFSFFTRITPRRFYHWLLYKKLPGIKIWGTGVTNDEGESR